jgi:hypothetical protein
MEALQMLKFLLKKKRLDFMAGWKTEESEMQEGSAMEKGSQPEITLNLLVEDGDTENARDALLVDDMD